MWATLQPERDSGVFKTLMVTEASSGVSVQELLRKARLYALPGPYWQSSGHRSSRFHSILGHYPVDLIPRLEQGHFGAFDSVGLPRRRHGKTLVYNYTTLAAFALANWSRWLESQEPEARDTFLSVAEFLQRTAVQHDGAAVFKADLPGQGNVGPISAMVQGESLSVLCRVYELTHDPAILELALACGRPFLIELADGGVRGEIKPGVPWYEEDTRRPVRHILNGMIYSLWGLRDLYTTTGERKFGMAFTRGAESVVSAIGDFDTGWWTWYDVPTIGRPYIASAMYHDLHICQTEILAEQIRSSALVEQAATWRDYREAPWNRVLAAAAMAAAKVRRDYQHGRGVRASSVG